MTFLATCSEIIVNKQPISDEQVDDYADALEAPIPAKFPPIVLRHSPEGFVLVDGRHRLAAHKRLGRERILARLTL